MSFLTSGVPALATFTGAETLPGDSNNASGQQPQQITMSLAKLARILNCLGNTKDKTMVSGTIYYAAYTVGATESFRPDSGLALTTLSDQSFLITGMNILVGSTGGTDTWYTGLYNSSGVLVASSTKGTTAGTASTIQQIPFDDGTNALTATITSGTYLLAVQSNGTTAKLGTINSPIWPDITGSQTGTAGTLAKITSVATTYTANLGPMASLY